MIVILLNGYPRSGKGEFIRAARTKYKCYGHSTIDFHKDIARLMGWDGIKDDTSRAMLSDLKKLHVKYFDGPFKELTHKIESASKYDVNDFFFTQSRECDEINRIEDWCRGNGYPFYYIFIHRDNKREYGNSSDDNVEMGCIPNIYFANNGSLDEYKERVLNLLDDIKNEKYPFDIMKVKYK
jgi:hypothetical protein